MFNSSEIYLFTLVKQTLLTLIERLYYCTLCIGFVEFKKTFSYMKCKILAQSGVNRKDDVLNHLPQVLIISPKPVHSRHMASRTELHIFGLSSPCSKDPGASKVPGSPGDTTTSWLLLCHCANQTPKLPVSVRIGAAELAGSQNISILNITEELFKDYR